MVLGSGKTIVLTQGEEALLVCAFNFMADAGLPLGHNQLVSMVRQYCVAANRDTPFRGMSLDVSGLPTLRKDIIAI